MVGKRWYVARAKISEAQGVARRIVTGTCVVLTYWVWKMSGATRSTESRPDQYSMIESE
ncbi:hypothetical protein ACWV2X_18405 [Streptomyces hydrogenans]